MKRLIRGPKLAWSSVGSYILLLLLIYWVCLFLVRVKRWPWLAWNNTRSSFQYQASLLSDDLEMRVILLRSQQHETKEITKSRQRSTLLCFLITSLGNKLACLFNSFFLSGRILHWKGSFIIYVDRASFERQYFITNKALLKCIQDKNSKSAASSHVCVL